MSQFQKEKQECVTIATTPPSSSICVAIDVKASNQRRLYVSTNQTEDTDLNALNVSNWDLMKMSKKIKDVEAEIGWLSRQEVMSL